MNQVAPVNEMPPFATDDERWSAVLSRDRRAEGAFYYSVRTTGVYCRPTCAGRRPRRENVAFHATREEAEQAGFRPCRRCRPDEDGSARAAAVARACRIIESAGDTPSLRALASAVGMSPFHFHRVFKDTMGVTPKAYADAHKARRVREELRRAGTVTEAIYGAGYSSSGRFYAASTAVLGMTPSDYRTGGGGTVIRFAVGETSLGSILVAATDKGVCAIMLDDDPERLVRELQDRFPRASLIGADKDFEHLVATVVGMVERPHEPADLPLDVRGTAFQQRVWQALREIPVGSTATYSEIAGRIGAPKAIRAVAHACAVNRIAVAIPCHRVVRTDGSLAGYRWGIARKQALLEREASR